MQTFGNASSTTMFGGNLGYFSSTTIGRMNIGDLFATSSLQIPNGTAPTVDATGEIAVDTTSDQLIYYGASSKRVIPPFQRLGFTYATTSWNATTTLYLGPAFLATTVNYMYCETDVGTVRVRLYDGTNTALAGTNIQNASTTITKFTLDTNNTFTAGESMRVDLGTPATSPTRIACSIGYTATAD